MKISNIIKSDYVSASVFAGVADLKKKIIQHHAIVIMEEDQYFGVLTAADIIRKPHIIAMDCICNKTEIEPNTLICNALIYMKRESTDVLPVFEKKNFIGLVFRNDILEYLNEQCQELQNEVEQYTNMLEEQKSDFEIIIQRQKQELEEVIEQRTKELIDLIETKEKFVRIVIHELRNPFNGILGLLSLLQKNLRKYDIDKIEKFLTKLYQSATITFDLLINLSEWLDAKNNKIPFNPEKTCINELLNNEILLTSLPLEQKQIRLNNDIPDNLYAYVDKNMVKTIFRNLIGNAAKFSNINGEITISAKEKEQFVEITIKDKGIGLSPEIIKKLFDMEGVNSLKGTAQEAGTGIGLLLCKEFVEIEGGKIWVESTLGEGSEFKFTLPKKYEQITAN